MAIQIRRGNKADLQVANLLPGEQVLALDTGEVGIKSAGGNIIWYATTSGTNNAFLAAHPVGAIYMSAVSTNPGTLFGGTWVAWGAGRVPIGVDTSQTEFNTVEKTGGEKTHTLSTAEMPSHIHDVQDNAYGSKICRGDAGGGTNTAYAVSSLPLLTNSRGVFRAVAQGGGAAHNNLQPYITCYMWKRTA